jgi:hypothetical protein
MTCRECLANLSELSADNLAASTIQTIQSHLEACPQCQREWSVFSQTLFVASTISQPLPAPEASQAMWEGCCDHIFNKIESRRAATGLHGWVVRQPRWGWVSLGGALAILGATWFLAPHDEAIDAITDNVNTQFATNQAGINDPGRLITFKRPPQGASSLVTHHSAMSADPLPDNVGSTMVSYSAAQPAGGH